MKRAAVIGLGYVGLPLAVQAAERQYEVFGIDKDKTIVDKVNKRLSPFANDKRLKKALKALKPGALTAYSTFDKLSDAQTIIICVPTPTEDNMPDLSYIKDATAEVAKRLKKGQLVILESTVNPGVTREEVQPILETVSGLAAGKDFCLVHCPERIDPGNPDLFVGNLNRVIGGVSKRCTKGALKFYRDVIDADIVPLASAEEAEFVKSWENTHRNVMIALANEAAVICDAMGMDIKNVLKGLQSKVDQFGLHLAQPGIGPGGHCIPEDIHYVIKKARQNGIDTTFLDSATELNDKMPRYAISQLQRILRESGKHIKDTKVALLGLAYKENIEDARRSPAIDVGHMLVQRAKALIVHDPYVKHETIHIKGAERVKSLETALKRADAVFIATAHNEYKQLDAAKFKKFGIKYVYDGRNCLDPQALWQGGLAYKGVGR